jgi:hypothetical protein
MSLLRGSASTSSSSADSVAFGRGLQDSTNPFQFLLSFTIPTTTTITATTTTNPFAYQGFGSTDNLQNCPVSLTIAFCSFVGKTPVVCAGGCEYDNFCLAAGTDLSDCVSSAAIDPDTNQKEVLDSSEPKPGTCPVTGPAVSCLDEADPVVCGIDDCAYNNPCLALGAGFQEEDCFSSQCPKPEAESCTKELIPVNCNDCIYDNICTAGAAGFLENDCEPVDQGVSLPVEWPFHFFRDIRMSEGIGQFVVPSLQVVWWLRYENGCVASGAGYLADDDCEPLEEPVELIAIPIKVIPVDSTIGCPERNPGLVCSAIFAPVVCGDCKYENGCIASGAGYVADDCESLEEPVERCHRSIP